MIRLHPGDVVELDRYDYAGRPPRLEHFTVAGVHEVTGTGRLNGWYVSALDRETAWRGWPSGMAELHHGGGFVGRENLMPWPGHWQHADDVRVVARASVQPDIFDLMEES